MKVLIHTDEYHPTAQACAYRMQVFVDTFIKHGNQVTVVTSSTNKSNGKIEKHVERIIYAPAIQMKKKTSFLRMLNNLSFGVTSIFSAISVGKVDVVITTSPPSLVSIPGWIIAKCKRAKLVYDVRDIWPDVALEMGSFSKDSFFCKAFGWITGFMYKHSDLITTVTQGKVDKIKSYVAARSGRKAGSEHTDKVKLISNGFDESVTQSAFDQTIVDMYELEEKPTCIYIGNIGLAQGLGALLDVAATTKHREMQFLLFGMGAEKDLLEKRIKNEGLSNVRLCGVVDHSKVFSLLSRAKISFIPLKNSKMKDSIPTKIYEALGIGCPVLLTAEGDSCAIVEESRFGRCVSPDHIEELKEVFDEMIDNYDELAAHRGEAIRLMHDKYSRQRIAENLIRICEYCMMNKY